MTGYMDEVGYVDMKEYWYHANRLRKRIDRKIHEIHMLRQRAEGINGSGMSDTPRIVSPNHDKMENVVFKIMALEKEVQNMQAELDALFGDIEKLIKHIDDFDLYDLLQKRYIEFKTWPAIAADFGYSVQNIYRLHTKALEKLRVYESM